MNVPTDDVHRHWYVLGAGAIGSLFAHRLAAVGCRITLLSRSPDETQRSLTLARGSRVVRRTFAVSSCTESGPVSRLLVTTKAADVDPALAGVSHRLHAASAVVVLANGMGFAADMPYGIAAFRGITTDGAFRDTSTHTVQAGSGETRIGLPGSAAPAPDWFTDSWSQLQDCVWDINIDTALWRKLAINCVINPLTALYGCRNGELATPAYRPVLQSLCEEVALACRAAGHGAAVESLLDTALQVIGRTADNRSSMLQDVLDGQPTEIDFINGFLVREVAVPAPHLPLNRRLIRDIKEKARQGDSY